MIAQRITEKVSQFILVALSTDKGGEAAAAMYAARRALDTEGVSIHEFAALIKNPTAANNGATPQALEAEYRRGRSDERAEREAKMQRSNGGVLLAKMAQFLAERINQVEFRHHGSINDMATKTARNYRLTPKQQDYLESLYFQHGGYYA
jgi:hypothetical protein